MTGSLCRAELTEASLRELTTGSVQILWHQGFYPTERCQHVLDQVVEHCERSQYTLTDDLQSLGTSLGEASESTEGADRYLDTAAATTTLIRESIFQGLLSPVDLLRLRLDELWPHGASVARHRGRMMLPGIIRRWPRGGQANPHIDQREVPLLADYRLSRRIGANVYLQVPPAGRGGEVEFWDRYRDESAYRRSRRSDYGLDRAELGHPQLTVLPAQGDLLMFDASRLHGVRRVVEGTRVTAACFIGVQGPDEPLLVFA